MTTQRAIPRQIPSPEAAVYVISVASELTGLHPQTLRTYERLGFVLPGRTGGGGRRYSLRDIELLREIADLTSNGIGLEGVRLILQLKVQVAELRDRNAELQAELEAARANTQQHLSSPMSPSLPNRLPVLRQPAAGPTVGQAMVLWRRGC
jgi:MerR family transcriptional regulator, heat shock protein HspR